MLVGLGSAGADSGALQIHSTRLPGQLTLLLNRQGHTSENVSNERTNTQRHRLSDFQTHRHTDTQTHRHTQIHRRIKAHVTYWCSQTLFFSLTLSTCNTSTCPMCICPSRFVLKKEKNQVSHEIAPQGSKYQTMGSRKFANSEIAKVRDSKIQNFRNSEIQKFSNSEIRKIKNSEIQKFGYSEIETFKNAII